MLVGVPFRLKWVVSKFEMSLLSLKELSVAFLSNANKIVASVL